MTLLNANEPTVPNLKAREISNVHDGRGLEPRPFAQAANDLTSGPHKSHVYI